MSWLRYKGWYVAYEDYSLDTKYYGTLKQALVGAIKNGKRTAIIGREIVDEYGNNDGYIRFGELRRRKDGWYVYVGTTKDSDVEDKPYLVSPNGMLTPIIPKKKKGEWHPFGL